MKTRLNLTVEKSLVTKAKKFAAAHDMSVSGMIEEMLEQRIEGAKKDTPYWLQVARGKKPKAINIPATTKEMFAEYYESRRGKYGL